MTQTTQLIINGESIKTTHDNVKAVIDEIGLTQGRYAVEVDGMLVPKSQLADTALIEGMQIEVVQAVGGG